MPTPEPTPPADAAGGASPPGEPPFYFFEEKNTAPLNEETCALTYHLGGPAPARSFPGRGGVWGAAGGHQTADLFEKQK